MTDAERQNEATRIQSEMERDGGLMWSSPNNPESPSKQPILPKYDQSVNHVSSDDQDEETSSSDVTNGRKRDDEKIVPMTDGIKEEDANRQHNNENGMKSHLVNTATIIIAPIPSPTLKNMGFF